jgi:hypothetical protein
MFEQLGQSKDLEITLFISETKMIAKSSMGWATHSIILASIALAFGLADARRSFAGCGGYCEAQRM